MPEKFINIRFPFSDSDKGYLLQMNKTSGKAIQSDLLHLIFTKKGDRLYMPDFGTNLLRHLFEPNDATTQEAIKKEINEAVRKYLPKLKIDDLEVTKLEGNEHVAEVKISYTVTDDVFQESETVIITI